MQDLELTETEEVTGVGGLRLVWISMPQLSVWNMNKMYINYGANCN